MKSKPWFTRAFLRCPYAAGSEGFFRESLIKGAARCASTQAVSRNLRIKLTAAYAPSTVPGQEKWFCTISVGSLIVSRRSAFKVVFIPLIVACICSPVQAASTLAISGHGLRLAPYSAHGFESETSTKGPNIHGPAPRESFVQSQIQERCGWSPQLAGTPPP